MPATETPARPAISRVADRWASNCPPNSTKYPSGSSTRCFDLLLDLRDRAGQVAARDVAADRLLAADVLAVDQVRPAGRLGKVGHVLEPHLPAAVRQVEPQLLQDSRGRCGTAPPA